MNEYERDSLKQQILRLKNRISELESETQEKNSIASLYQTKALYWHEIAERQRKINKEITAEKEMLHGLLNEQLRIVNDLKEEQQLDQQVINELQQQIKKIWISANKMIYYINIQIIRRNINYE